MSTSTAAGIVLIVSALWFNVWFAVLAHRFDYPDILRRPTAEILDRFRAGGSGLILIWWAFTLSGGFFLASVVLLSRSLGGACPTLSLAALVVGAIAALVQILGLLRWVYLVPALARAHADADTSPASREAVAVTFRAFHQYLGVGVGEHLGYLLTGVWTLLVGLVLICGDVVGSWAGWVALPIGAGLALGSTEFLGPNEERGWRLAGTAIPVLYVAWSLWLVVLGLALVV